MMSMLLQHTGPRGHRRRYGNGKIRASIRNATVIPLKARLVTPALHTLAQAQFGRNSSRFGRNVRALPENEALAWSRPSPGRLGPLPGLRALALGTGGACSQGVYGHTGVGAQAEVPKIPEMQPAEPGHQQWRLLLAHRDPSGLRPLCDLAFQLRASGPSFDSGK